MIIADTDVLIDYLSGKGASETVSRLLQQGGLRTTVISRFELLSGARSAKERSVLMELLEAVPSLELNNTAADAASEIRRHLEHIGSSIGMADSLIAGIVNINGGVLLTRSRRHFERVPGLKLV